MRRKIWVPLLVAIALVSVLFGWNALAATSPNVSSPGSLTGSFKALGTDNASVTITTAQGDQSIPLAKSVWVYRNEQKAQLSDLKVGDRIELIMNSKNQAAYVKAAAEVKAASEPQPQQAEPTPVAPVPAPATPPEPPAVQQPQPQPQPQTQVQPQTKQQMKLDDGDWIKELLGDDGPKSENAKQQALRDIAKRYGVDVGKLQAQLQAQLQVQAAHPDDGQDGEQEDGNNDNKSAQQGQLGKQDQHGQQGQHGKSKSKQDHNDD